MLIMCQVFSRDNGSNKTEQVSAPYSKEDFMLNLTMTQYSCLNPAVYIISRVVLWVYKGEMELKCF